MLEESRSFITCLGLSEGLVTEAAVGYLIFFVLQLSWIIGAVFKFSSNANLSRKKQLRCNARCLPSVCIHHSISPPFSAIFFMDLAQPWWYFSHLVLYLLCSMHVLLRPADLMNVCEWTEGNWTVLNLQLEILIGRLRQPMRALPWLRYFSSIKNVRWAMNVI